MRILVAGLGSIGRRHARNLRTLLGDELDLLAYRVRGEGDVDFPSFTDLDEALAQKPDVVFVTNPASEHVRVAVAAAHAGAHVFVEKPVSDTLDGLDELIELVEARSVVGMVGYQLRFHPAFVRLREFVAEREVVGARFEVGEYLPDMHPWEDYRRLNYSRRDQGGGVLLQFSHEFDLAYALFGMPRRVFCVGGKRSDLEIDVEDTASTLLDCDGVSVHVLQDFLRRPPVRRYEVTGRDGNAVWDDREEHVDRNDLFLDELRHFLACVDGHEQPRVDLRAGADVLRIALAARLSLQSGDGVEP